MSFINSRRLFALASVLVLAAVSASSAQSPQYIAEAISSDDMTEYADILALSEAQQAAIEPLYRAYKERYRELFDGEATAMMQRYLEMEHLIAAAEDARVRRDQFADVRRLHHRLAGIEDAYFGEWVDYLSEVQRDRLSIVIELRRRRRIISRTNSGIGFHTGPWAEGGMTLIMRRRVQAVEPTTSEWRAAEPIVRAHEIELNKLLQRFDDVVMEHDWAQSRRLNEWRSGFKPVVEAALPILALHKRTMEAITPLLNDERAEAFRLDILGRLYPDVIPDFLNADRTLRHVDIDSLAPEMREAIEALRAEHIAQHTALTTQLMGLMDEAVRLVEFWISNQTGVEPPAINRRLLALLEQRRQLNQATEERAKAILGEERYLTALRLGGVRSVRGTMWIREPPVYMTISLGEATMGARPPGWPIPLAFTVGNSVAPVTSARLEAYAALLGCDDEQKRQITETIGALQADVEPLLRPARSRAYRWTQEWTTNPNGTLSPPSADWIEQALAQRREAVELVQHFDLTLLDAIRAVLSDDQRELMPLVELTHRRWRLGGVDLDAFGVYLSGTTTGNSIDLVEAVAGTALGEDQYAAIQPELIAYAQRGAAIQKRRTEAAEHVEQRLRELLLAQAADQVTAHFDLSGDTPHGRALIDVCLDYRAACLALEKLNETTLPQLEVLLPRHEARLLRTEAYRLMQPFVIDDPTTVHDLLVRALTLETLGDTQRNRLIELQSSYRATYEALTDRYFAARIHAPVTFGFMLIERGEFVRPEGVQDLQREANRCREEREELNASTRRQLGFILTEAQRRELGMEDEA